MHYDDNKAYTSFATAEEAYAFAAGALAATLTLCGGPTYLGVSITHGADVTTITDTATEQDAYSVIVEEGEIRLYAIP